MNVSLSRDAGLVSYSIIFVVGNIRRACPARLFRVFEHLGGLQGLSLTPDKAG
jgi:hypothetical protein